MPPTNRDHTKNKSYDDICSKNYHNISGGVGIQQILSGDSKSFLNNDDINRVGDEMTLIEAL